MLLDGEPFFLNRKRLKMFTTGFYTTRNGLSRRRKYPCYCYREKWKWGKFWFSGQNTWAICTWQKIGKQWKVSRRTKGLCNRLMVGLSLLLHTLIFRLAQFSFCIDCRELEQTRNLSHILSLGFYCCIYLAKWVTLLLSSPRRNLWSLVMVKVIILI